MPGDETEHLRLTIVCDPAERIDEGALMMKQVSPGGWISIGGVAAVFLSLFLPVVDSSVYADVVSNSLIQKADGLIVLGLLAVAIGLIVRSEQKQTTSSAVGVIVAGVLTTGLALILLLSDAVRVLQPAGRRPDDLYGALDYLSMTEKADPGIGLILCLLGSVAILVGGIFEVIQRKQQT